MKKKVNKRRKNLWGGRFKKNPSKQMVDINASIKFDSRLYLQDILASKAHAKMLYSQKIISSVESKKIISGLDQIKLEIEKGKMKFKAEFEDIHTHIEKRLISIIGNDAKKLHTARSRNDQVATDVKIWIREECENLDKLLKNLQASLIGKAQEHFSDIMPGFTHLQPAQPITLGHHLLAYVEMFGRDRINLRDLKRHNFSPLGSAALAGTTFPINREQTASLLGFSGIMRNSMDAVSDRDFILDTLNLCCLIFIHLSRLSEEVILWSSPVFDFLKLPDEFSTGSSIMPQKRNPDAAELIRGKSGRVIGNYVALFNVMKALPLAYSKDMQEDKEPLFDSIDNTKICLTVMSDMFKKLSFNRKKMLKICEEGYITATDLADWLVKDLSFNFRDAHSITGKMVAFAEEQNLKLEDLDINDIKKISPKINKDIFKFMKLESSIKSRSSAGGTNPDNVYKEIILSKKKWL